MNLDRGIIRTVPEFAALDDAEADALVQLAAVVRKKKGDVIVKENAPGDALYIVLSGSVRVAKLDLGKVVEIAKLKTGEVFGEISLLDEMVTSASVIADETTDLAVIRRGDFTTLLQNNPVVSAKVYRAFCLVLAERLRATNNLYTVSVSPWVDEFDW